MYKELIISIIIIICIVTLDIMIQKYINFTIEETIQGLSEINEHIKKKDINNEEIINKGNSLYQKWMEYHDKLAYFIEHDELEKVETNFISAKSYIESEDYESASSDISKTIFVLEHISDKYAFNLDNIF